MNTKTKAKEDSATKEIQKRWGKTLTAPGWTAIPNVILEKQAALGLTTTEVCILMHLAKHWWKAGEVPFPSKTRIAKAIGITPRQVQRCLKSMEDKGLVLREERRTATGSRTNLHHLDGLLKKARPYAQEAIREREKREAAENARLRRKKPLLEIVQ